MKTWRLLIFLLLLSSLSLNVYLLSQSGKNVPQVQNKPLPNHVDPIPLLTLPQEVIPKTDSTKSKAMQAKVEQNQQPSREHLLGQANRWLTDKDFIALEILLQNYLKQYPQDMDFLLIEAQLKLETSLLSDAIIYYYDLLRMPMTVTQKNHIEKQIKDLTGATIEQLTNNYSWDILAIFVEPLLQLEPNNRQYILSLARAYAELVQAGLMENVLASLNFDDPGAEKIRQILLTQQAMQTDENSTTEAAIKPQLSRPIPLKQIGDHYLVNGSLSSNPVTLLIDTGASITAISTKYFRQLSNRYKINYLGRFNVGTAGGRVMASMYQFRELTIQHVTLENLAVVVLPMQGMEQADGLLGMNFLKEFDFKIDQAQSVLFLN